MGEPFRLLNDSSQTSDIYLLCCMTLRHDDALSLSLLVGAALQCPSDVSFVSSQVCYRLKKTTVDNIIRSMGFTTLQS